jgi:hypothetical protein
MNPGRVGAVTASDDTFLHLRRQSRRRNEQSEMTEHTEITEQAEKELTESEAFRSFRYFRVFRHLSSSWLNRQPEQGAGYPGMG